MKVIMFGNIAVGKTTLIKTLNNTYNWETVLIDEYRIKYSDGSVEGEYKAKEKFFEAVAKDTHQFIECLGTGKMGQRLFEIFETVDEKVICVLLKTSIETLATRFTSRDWEIAPFPEPVSKIEELVIKTQERIEMKQIENIWNGRSNTSVLVKYNNNFDDFNKIVAEISELINKAH